MRRAKPRSRKKAVYGLLPRDVLHHPPWREWRPFDVAVVCALLVEARSALAQDRHTKALASGAELIEQEKLYAHEYKRAWKETKARRRDGIRAPAPERFHPYDLAHPEPKPTKRYDQYVEKAGKLGYRNAQRVLRRAAPPKWIDVELSRFALLRLGHLSTDAKNLRALDATIARLQKPIRIGGNVRVPVITSVTIKRGQIRCRVSGQWLEPPFGKVPMPLPTRSSAATALYLFLRSIRTNFKNTVGSDTGSLCRRIGIPTNQPPSVCQRALDRALDAVNRHLHRLNANRLNAANVKIPDSYKVVASGPNIRFESVPRSDSKVEERVMRQEKTSLRRARRRDRDDEVLQPRLHDLSLMIHDEFDE